MEKPLLFIEVDGILMPDFANKDFYARKRWMSLGFSERKVKGLAFRHLFPTDRIPLVRVILADWHGDRLREMDCYDGVFTSDWEDGAPETIGAQLGLPHFAGIEMERYPPEGFSQFTRPILNHARGRPFCWVTCTATDTDYQWLVRRMKRDDLFIYRIDPDGDGLDDIDLDTIYLWGLAKKMELNGEEAPYDTRFGRYSRDLGGGLWWED